MKMFDYIMSIPLLGGVITGAILWGILYLVLGLVYKDSVAKNMGFWALVIGLILLIIA